MDSPFRDVIKDFADGVLEHGHLIESRYGPCRETFAGQLIVPSGTLVTRQGINWSLGWMEVLQLVAGEFSLEGIKRVAPNANHSLFTYAMAYGPRIADQMPDLIDTLIYDPDSRQVVLFIGNPEDGPTSNLPCTLTMQFLLRGGRIHGLVSMRSWDLCRGLPYDLMMFSSLIEIVGICTGHPSGHLIVTAGSTHIYEDQLTKLPQTSAKNWKFRDSYRTQKLYWGDWRVWASMQIPILGKGGTPDGIEIY